MSQGRLWAPWRLGYIEKAQRSRSETRCIFCAKARSRADVRNLVVARSRHGFSMLNLYPYNNGHTLIAPYRHVASPKAFTVEEWVDLLHLTNDAIRRLEKVLSPAAYNLGANLGQAAGAGIPGHFHLHVVPRWGGDTNFMPVLADAKVIPQSLDSACRLLRKVGSAHPSTCRRHPC